MKPSRHAKVGLCIGLLSLNILSACVNTRKELGWWPNWLPIRQGLGLTRGNANRFCNDHPGIVTTCKVVGWSSLILAPFIYYFQCFGGGEENGCELWSQDDDSGMHYSSNSNKMSCFNISVRSMPTGWNISTTPYNMTPELERFITKAIKDGDEKWGTHNTTESPFLIKRPMVLDEQIMSDIKAHDFSTKIIQCWLNQGLNINARDPKNSGWTLLIYAVFRRNTDAVKFLLGNGADVNAQDNAGATSLSMAMHWEHEGIINLLIKHKADPCIENNRGDSPKSDAEFRYKKATDRENAYEMNLWSSIIRQFDAATEKLHRTKQCRPAG